MSDITHTQSPELTHVTSPFHSLTCALIIPSQSEAVSGRVASGGGGEAGCPPGPLCTPGIHPHEQRGEEEDSGCAHRTYIQRHSTVSPAFDLVILV